LEGLEIVETKLSELLFDNEIFRIDSEFQSKEFNRTNEIIKKTENYELNNLIELLTDGKHGGVTLTKGGVIFLRTTNIKENEIDLSDLRFISDSESKETLRAEFKENDLLLTTIGTIGLCVKVPNNFPRATINQNLVRIVLNDKNLSSFICCFLNSRYGRNQLLRYGAGNVYQMINYPNLRKIIIPKFSNSFYKKIDEFYLLSEQKRNKSQQTYTQAENLLLETLDFKDFKPSEEKINVKSFKDSFLSTGRLDAEYYQPKYEEIVEKIKESNYAKLTDLVNIKKSIEPGSNAYSNEGLPFLRVADYNKLGISEPQKCLSDSYIKENADKLNNLKPKAETILFSKDGSVGMAYMLKENKNLITSGAILHLTVKNKEQVLPEYLTLVLNSQAVQMQAERDAGGSIILHWRVGEIENVIIPIIDFNIQQQISNKIEESFRLKEQSEHLIELAKTAVEKAIEEDEEKSLNFIKRKLQQNNENN
jgi:restriction endonuclease S subunit